MGSSGEANLLSSLKWQDQPVTLKDFAAKHSVPNIVKVTKGQYRGAIGVAKSVHSELFLYSISTGKKVLVESVKIKDGKATCSQQKYGIPFSYQGWFEVLSENGQAVKPLFSMGELLASASSSKNPHPTYLVREGLKGLTASDPDAALDSLSDIPVGEIVTVGSEVWKNVNLPKGVGSHMFVPLTMQSNNVTVYIRTDSKCKLSPIAGVQNISGVHNVHALLDKFRLPIMVRLVHGLIPTKLEKRFTAIFRLLRVYGDETIFFCPLKKDSKMVPISTREPLKVVAAQNFDDVKDTTDLETLSTRCQKMHASFMNSIHVLYSAPEPEPENGTAGGKGATVSPAGPIVEEDILFEEVEDIYMHVRQGGEPPPPRPRPAHITQPQPPPIPKKEGKKTSILGSFAMKFTRNKDGGGLFKSSTSNAIPSSPTSPVTPTSPVSPTEDHRHPPPLPDKKAPKSKDFDYWEEPIYEPLEKIRSMKKLAKEHGDTVIQMGSSPPRLLSDDAIEPMENPLAAMTNSDEIKTLRDMYKHSDGYTGSNNSANSSKDKHPSRSSKKSNSPVHIPNPDYDLEAEPAPPPVPPKNFDVTELEAKLPKASPSEDTLKQVKAALKSSGETPRGHHEATRQASSPNSTSNPTSIPASSKTPYVRSHSLQPTSQSAVSPRTGSSPSAGAHKLGTSPHGPIGLSHQHVHMRRASPTNNQAPRPYLIKNVTPSDRKMKGTTVMLDGSSAARISTPPSTPLQIRPSPTQPQPVRPSHVQQAAAAIQSKHPPNRGGSNKRHAPTPPQAGGHGNINIPTGAASKMSLGQQTPVQTGPHPPFVAVARVGDTHEQTNPLFNNGVAVAHRVSDGRKLQSMYL